MSFPRNIEMIDNEEALAALSSLIASLDADDFISLDTEFTRTKTYYPIFDLLQLNIHGVSYLVDPLNFDLSQLFYSLNNSKACILMFSCREDVEVIFHYCKSHNLQECLPAKIADIQLLQSFLGISYSQGLQSSLQERLNISLDKSETRSDWSVRPLSNAQILYAACDVAYLEDLYKNLLSTCEKNDKRLQWFFMHMRDLVVQAQKEIAPEDIYMYISGAGSLTSKQLQILSYLCYKRELFVWENNVAVSRVLSNKCIVQVAVATPLTYQGLASCRLKWGAIRQYGKLVISWVKEAIAKTDYVILKNPYDFVVNTKEGADEARRLKHLLEEKALAGKISSELLLQKFYIHEYLYVQRKGGVSQLEQGWRALCIGSIDKDYLKKGI